jgi:hypothetical protein
VIMTGTNFFSPAGIDLVEFIVVASAYGDVVVASAARAASWPMNWRRGYLEVIVAYYN